MAEKQQKKKKGCSVQELLGIRTFTKYGLAVGKYELLFYLVAPTNISVLSHTNAITDQFPQERRTPSKPRTAASGGPIMTEPVEATPEQELNHIAEQAKTPKPLRTG